jgi:hypothetical protein
MTVKIFTIQRDEDDILEDWLRYHIYLFGKENVYVIDHKSKKSRATIEKYGVNLIKYDGPFELNGKANILSKTINDHKAGSTLVLPVDVDEFVIQIQYNEQNMFCKVICDRDTIRKRLAQYAKEATKDGFKFQSLTTRVNGQDDVLTTCDQCGTENKDKFSRWKSFYAAKKFSRTDQGNHGVPGETYHKTDMGLIHFHNRGFDHFKQKYLRWKDTYGKCWGMNGSHWKKVYDQIEGKTDEEMRKVWMGRINTNKGDHKEVFIPFHEKIRELRSNESKDN